MKLIFFFQMERSVRGKHQMSHLNDVNERNMTTYQTLQDEVHGDAGVLFHVVEQSRSRWSHIQDLDSFFKHMYKYHQMSGYLCMVLDEVCRTIQMMFMLIFTLLVTSFIDYPRIFSHTSHNSTISNFFDIFLSLSIGMSQMHWTVCTVGLFALILIVVRIGWGIFNLIIFWEIKQFYNKALGVADSDLKNLTWNQILTKIKAVQLEQEMCIHKRELTELDIYHRILRQENYFVAMANKRLIPPRIPVPFVEEIVYWPQGLHWVLSTLLFSRFSVLFDEAWKLKEDCRKPNNRHEMANKFRYQCWLVGLFLFLMSPLTFVCYGLYIFYNYGEMLRRDPSFLGFRKWSSYAYLNLPHFNELKHEVNARLSRARKPAAKYLSSFRSPLMTTIARTGRLICGTLCISLLGLSLFGAELLIAQHYIAVAFATGVGFAVAHALVTEPAEVSHAELLAQVFKQTHYLPPGWQTDAHTTRIRMEIQQLYQYNIASLLEEILSPIVIPFVLVFYIAPRSLEIVDFLRNFTVTVAGVGDVCSFAQMDVRQHGNPDWHDVDGVTPKDQYTQAEDGKTELSLIHFHFTNPKWIPPPDSLTFVETLQRESTYIQSQIDPNLMTQTSDDPLRQYPYPGASHREGPLNSLPMDLNLSTAILHERHNRHRALNAIEVQSSRYVHSPEPVAIDYRHPQPVETTPLLYN